MILRLTQFVVEQEANSAERQEIKPKEIPVGKLKINWVKPDLAEDIDHYDDKAKLEFYQHNITIGNKDIGKVAPRSTKFYKYISSPFKNGNFETVPLFSDDEFNINSVGFWHYNSADVKMWEEVKKWVKK